MPNKWKITTNPIGGRLLYGVFRIIDHNEIDHSGNREIYAYFGTREEAEKVAGELNEGGEGNGQKS